MTRALVVALVALLLSAPVASAADLPQEGPFRFLTANFEIVDADARLCILGAELLQHALSGEPAEPVLFFPKDYNPKEGLPIRLTDVKVKDKDYIFHPYQKR